MAVHFSGSDVDMATSNLLRMLQWFHLVLVVGRKMAIMSITGE